MNRIYCVLALCCLVLAADAADSTAPTNRFRSVLTQAAISQDAAEQIALIRELVGADDGLISRALAAWRVGELFLHHPTNGSPAPILLDSKLDAEGRARGIDVSTGEFIVDAAGKPVLFLQGDLTAIDNSSRLRRAIKTTLDLYAVNNPQPKMRRDAVIKLGQEQNAEYLPHFQNRIAIENDAEVRKLLKEAIALTLMASTDTNVQIAAVTQLGEMRSINGLEFLKNLQKTFAGKSSGHPETLVHAVRLSIAQIENYLWWGNLFGTAFRGFSLAAVLLVAALGLAITFGLMGVINMAHGEVMAIGAYTAYFVQGIFGTGLLFSLFGKQMSVGGFGLTGYAFDSYFIVALLASFVTAALAGLALERGVIRFLYKRPLESLLATWGVSLVLQQILRHTFGAANVQVNSPSWLTGSYVLHDVLFAFNRLFVIGFAVFIVFCTYLLLTRTSLGLQIRAVMQNRTMASCMGVRTDRVNMMTFMLGSGLAGMAGACMSQIANVGPSLGQSYIIDCFMIVVLGGVGNIVGTVSASLGVGVTDQILQPWLGAVLGKITVLAAIILFLQWRPNGIFVTRSRSLDG
ncbi:MAG TPA: urea ABC transporter permease subunit UrtB [Verrucomicrobiae bacterium]|nr:urea ABC transporter permease subunit UrtB [Verrucomicrobiae bacterium]